MTAERTSIKSKPRSNSQALTRAASVRNVFQGARSLSPLQAHDLVAGGLPVAALRELMASFRLVDRDAVLNAVGISERTLQRANAADKPLDSNASDRMLRLASVAEMAIEVLGSQDAAERWLSAPAIGLDQRRPIDLLQSTGGTELVKKLLIRMDYGVYA
jgi:putative toxin-antitoxin system antitoxin component (TIGR02293 family)